MVDDVLAEFAASLSEEDRSKLQWFGKYYVYVLLRPNGSPFYVGKGQGNRTSMHVTEAIMRETSPRHDFIRQMLASGERIGKHKFAYFDEEKDAFRIEMLLIDYLGLENLANSRSGRGKRRPAKPFVRPPVIEITKEQIGDRKTAREVHEATGFILSTIHQACYRGTIPAVQCEKRWYIDTKSEQFQYWASYGETPSQTP